MNVDYDRQYFILCQPDDDRLPFLVPDERTQDRSYRFEKQAVRSAPLIFSNAWTEQNRNDRIVAITPKVLFEGNNVVVHSDIHEKLIKLDLPGVHMHPSVYVDDVGARHEGYWYLTFLLRFDCWDRDTSHFETDDPPVELGGEKLYQVYTYGLNTKLLDRTSLRDRLLFKMGGTIDAFVVCHASLRPLFVTENNCVRLLALADY